MQHKFVLIADASEHDHIKGAWTSGISIYVGDWYTSGNIVYECILAHTSAGGNLPPNATYWIPVIPAGIPLGSVSWKGAWSGATTYAAGDGCTYSSKAYVSIVGSNLNHVPPNATYWVEVYYSYTGDVVGPGSAVSSNMAEFDGTTGKIIKDGALTHANVADAITKKHSADTDPSETSGWVPAPALTYSAADAPVYTVTCSGDYSAIIMSGMRIKLTHAGSTKYFIVVKSAYGAPNTTLTLYGGTDYTLAGTAITNPYYSMHKAPAEFPLDPNKWKVEIKNDTAIVKTSPTATRWYGTTANKWDGSTVLSLDIPIGIWDVFFGTHLQVYKTSATVAEIHGAASSTDPADGVAPSDPELEGYVYFGGASATLNIVGPIARRKTLVLTSKTTYKLIGRTDQPADGIYLNGLVGSIILRAICAYL
jgi:hypothetical protein